MIPHGLVVLIKSFGYRLIKPNFQGEGGHWVSFSFREQENLEYRPKFTLLFVSTAFCTAT